ncbi:MAG: glycosyltransferase family 2 protein [Nitrospinales bacterium]
MPDISVVVPIYNEEEIIPRLHSKLKESLIGLDAEILAIDDGSDDKSAEEIKKFTDWTYIYLPRSGKSMALKEGIERAKGRWVVMIDADLQEDPKILPKFLKKLEEGYECVAGWRLKRKDGFWSKRIPSWCFNQMIKVLFGLGIHDNNCGFRVCLTESLRSISWFDGCHRFIPLLIWKRGGRVTEIPVLHMPRIAGKGKFNSPIRFLEALIHMVKLRLGFLG